MNIDYKLHELHNGVKLMYIPRKDNNISTISIFVRVGSRHENHILEGASHFIEHMLFKGTKKRPDTKSISGELDAVGAYFNAYTDKNITSYIIKINSTFCKKGIDILSDMLLHSTFTKSAFTTEKHIVIEEIHRGKDTPSDYIIDNIYALLYKDHPLEHSIGGIDNIIINYNRKKVLKYYKHHYCSNNIVISISSNKSFEDILDIVSNSDFTNFKLNTALKFKKHILNTQLAPRYSVIFRNNLEQIHLAIGFPIEGMYSKDRFALDILKVILAGNMSSRLFIDLREKAGLAYNVSIDLSYYEECGNFIIYTSIDKDSLFYKRETKGHVDTVLDSLFTNETHINNSKLRGGLSIILDNLILLKNKVVSNRELKSAKGFLNGHLIIEKEDSHSITDYFGKQYIFNYKPILNFDYLLKQYNKVTKKDIKHMCNKYFDFKRLNISIIGNCSKDELQNFLINNYIS